MSNPIKDSLKAKSPEQEATAPEIHSDQVSAADPEVQSPQPAPKTDKDKPKLRINKKNVALIAGSVLTAVAFLGGGLLWYNHYQKTKPVGVEKVVQTNSGEVETKSEPVSNTVEVAGGGTLSDRGYDMLWQSQASGASNGNDEFADPNRLRDTLIELLKTGNAEDANQAAALWVRNRENYDFTTKDSLTAAAIGHDAIIMDEYQRLVNGVNYAARANQDVALATRINEEFQSPWAMAFAAAGLHINGTTKLVRDSSSTQMDFAGTPIRSYSIKQYNAETAVSDATLVKHTLPEHDHSHETEEEHAEHAESAYYEAIQAGELVDATINVTAAAFRSDSNANRVYEVIMSNGKRDGMVVIVETKSGDLYVYGTYLLETLPTDIFIGAYVNSDTYTGSISDQTQDAQPQNWEQFQDQVEKYFGN